MEHSIALVTGTTSGLGYAAARILAGEGWREIIVTGRSLDRVKETAAQLAAETKTQVFTPLELELDTPASVQSALAELVKRGRPIDFLLLNAGMVPGKKRVLTAAGVEASQAPLIGHHQLAVGLLRAGLLSPDARIVIAGAEPARGGVPMFSYTDVPAFAAKYYRGDQAAAVEALIRNGPEREVRAQQCVCRREAHCRLVGRGAGAPATLRHGRLRCIARCGDRYQGFATSWPGREVSVYPNREPHSRHESDAGDCCAPVYPGLQVRNRRLRAILRLGAREILRPNCGAAPPAPSQSRQSEKPPGRPSSRSPAIDFSPPHP